MWVYNNTGTPTFTYGGVGPSTTQIDGNLYRFTWLINFGGSAGTNTNFTLAFNIASGTDCFIIAWQVPLDSTLGFQWQDTGYATKDAGITFPPNNYLPPSRPAVDYHVSGYDAIVYLNLAIPHNGYFSIPVWGAGGGYTEFGTHGNYPGTLYNLAANYASPDTGTTVLNNTFYEPTGRSYVPGFIRCCQAV